MTNQELFDTVAAHLLRQHARSTRPFTQSPANCAYRGDGGRKCAIGVLIPDERYTVALEGQNVYTPDVLNAAQLDTSIPHQGVLAGRLQWIHDCNSPEAWHTLLGSAAADYELHFTPPEVHA